MKEYEQEGHSRMSMASIQEREEGYRLHFYPDMPFPEESLSVIRVSTGKKP
jgi:hypothetical protein